MLFSHVQRLGGAAVWTCLAAFLTADPSAVAQRATTNLEFGDHGIEIDHGRPKLGDHTPDALQPGTTWRLGLGDATVLRTDLPLLGEPGQLIAPGDYRVLLYRDQQDGVYWLQADFAPAGLGEAGRTTMFRGAMGEAESSAPRLALSLHARPVAAGPETGAAERDDSASAEAADAGDVHPADLTIHFGRWQVGVPFVAVASGAPLEVGRTHRLTPFGLPEKWLQQAREGRRSVVLASLEPRRRARRNHPQSHNLVLRGSELRLVPRPRAPTDSYGFGDPEPWPDTWSSASAVEWLERDTVAASLTFTEVEHDRRQGMIVSFGFGHHLGTATLAVPDGRRR